MANKTVSRAQRNEPGAAAEICVKRLALARDALYEISLVSMALRDHIDAKDELGELAPLSRGMLSRVRLLSEAVSELIDEQSTEDYSELARDVECGPSRVHNARV
jgi:hypothetical protein